MTNAASYAADAVSPGEITVLFGPTFGPASLQLGASSGVRVLFDGIPAPVVYARVGQVSAVVPFAVQGKSTTQLQYQYQGVTSNALQVPVNATTPGVFTLDSSGKGPAAILDSGNRVIGKDNPARHGDVVQLFATGGGTTAPPITDGETSGKAALNQAASVSIGGVDCPVVYAGSAPGLIAGAVQVNVQIPAGVPSGDQPLVLTIEGVASQPGVTVTIQ